MFLFLFFYIPFYILFFFYYGILYFYYFPRYILFVFIFLLSSISLYLYFLSYISLFVSSSTSEKDLWWNIRNSWTYSPFKNLPLIPSFDKVLQIPLSELNYGDIEHVVKAWGKREREREKESGGLQQARSRSVGLGVYHPARSKRLQEIRNGCRHHLTLYFFFPFIFLILFFHFFLPYFNLILVFLLAQVAFTYIPSSFFPPSSCSPQFPISSFYDRQVFFSNIQPVYNIMVTART